MKQLIKACSLFTFYFLLFSSAFAQPLKQSNGFTHADTLRGTYGTSRDWWDVLKYNLHVKFNIGDSSISGYNAMQVKVLKKASTMQVDLQEPLMIDSILYSIQPGTRGKISEQDIRKDGNAYFFPASYFSVPHTNFPVVEIFVYYHGKPRIAHRPPWDGGVIWKKDKLKRPWVSIACQGLGASVWYPCKDHQADEPDSAEMHITVPDTLMCVGNGRYRGRIENGDGTATYDWAVVNPINNYNIIPYIGKYVHFSDVYDGEKGKLTMDYWVLDYNLE